MPLGAGQNEAVDAIVDGDGRPVVIVGGPGTGKSLAVGEAKELLADMPGVVVFSAVPSWAMSSDGVFPVSTLVYALKGTGRATPESLKAAVEDARRAQRMVVFVDEVMQLSGASVMALVTALDGFLGGPRYTQARVQLVFLGDPFQVGGWVGGWVTGCVGHWVAGWTGGGRG
jgi:hypothetical protein